MSVAEFRLIDANANRAREGIRTAEDYLRFVAEHSRWSAALKNMRAELTSILLGIFLEDQLLRSRQVSSDPLRPAETGACANLDTQAGEPPVKVAQRGLKRAQEALRVLEEYLRAGQPGASAKIERFRYTLYEIEQWLVVCGERARTLASATVYVLLTESLCSKGLFATAHAVLKSGVKLLQFREKEKSDRQFIEQARDLLKLCKDFDAVLICNDRVSVAAAVGAAGVHLGQNDLTPTEARHLFGERFLLGRSTHSLEQAQNAARTEPVDYIAIGAMYATSTKQTPVIAGLKTAEEVSGSITDTPVFAIGGITLNRIKELKSVGVKQVALSTAVISAPDPEYAACRFLEAMAN